MDTLIVVYLVVAVLLAVAAVFWLGIGDEADDILPLVCAAYLWLLVAVAFVVWLLFAGVYRLGQWWGRRRRDQGNV